MTTTDMPPADFVFADAAIPNDTTPPTEDGVESPCQNCGKEAGLTPTGRHRKFCDDCKDGGKRRSTVPRVTGASASLAAQATGVLEQLNGMIAIATMALGFTDTGHAIASANEQFREQAYAALVTDKELCRLILKGGVKSAKLSLGIAYAGMGMTVIPTAVTEYKHKKAAREAEYEQE